MKTFTGTVVSNRMQKVVSVLVERSYFHPKYGKLLRKFRKIHAADEKGSQIGQRVIISQTKPLSKTVSFRVVEIIGNKEPKKEKTLEEKKVVATKKKTVKKSKTEGKE